MATPLKIYFYIIIQALISYLFVVLLIIKKYYSFFPDNNNVHLSVMRLFFMLSEREAVKNGATRHVFCV